MRFIILFIFLYFISFIYCHCQVPCGIYDDPLRIKQLLEDVTTIKKSIKEIQSIYDLEDKTITQSNQFIRWINTKEKHASNIITILSEYFMLQRVSEGDIDYLKEIHHSMKLAMKCKQTVDLSIADSLYDSIYNIGHRYHMWDVIVD